MLKVFADRIFELHLRDAAEEIFVPLGKELFTSGSLPAGVKIKIRNGNGEVLTAAFGSIGWYTPAIYWSGIDVVWPNEERELLRADQRSADFKLSGMLMMLRRNLKNQDDLEFKLSVRLYLHDYARDAKGETLGPGMFPDYEIDWLDGGLLFAGE